MRRRDAPPATTARINTTGEDLRAMRPRRALLVPLLAVAALAALGYVALQRMGESRTQAVAEAPQQPKLAAAEPPPALPAAEDSSPTPPADSEPTPAAAPEPAVSAAAAPGPASSATTPSPGELRRVNLVTDPPGARLFWRGKEMGTTPFVLEIPAGERRSFELGLPGYVTRKLVLDGSRSDISIGLRPDSSGSQTGTKRN